MNQLSKTRSVFYHLYPGIIITVFYVMASPLAMRYHYPPQFVILVAIAVVAVPVMLLHLNSTREKENTVSVLKLNGFTEKLSTLKLILYSSGLVTAAFVIWGLTQPLNQMIIDNGLNWLPQWYVQQDFKGYKEANIEHTLILNLLLNGLLAPFIEELYFRGYLLPRMQAWGKSSVLVSALLFSLYHFWQPYLYVTIFLSLLPMTYVVYKTKDLRVGILTHCLLNLIGAILTFALLKK